jgi:hypothetical protein
MTCETADNSWMHGAVNHNEGEGEWQDRMDYGKSIF